MTMRTDRRWIHWAAWGVATVLITAALLPFRDSLDKAHVALIYLLLVFGGSVTAGHRVGLTLAAISFVLFDWFFVPPYNTLVVTNPLDWLVLVSFLIVSVVAAQLFHRLQVEAVVARERANEIDHLATLGAETLNVARADDALTAIAEVIRRLGPIECRIYQEPAADGAATPANSLIRWVADNGRAAVLRADGTSHLTGPSLWTDGPIGDARELLLPLKVRDRTVGVLQLIGGHMTFDASQRRYLDALAFYAALAVERARLEVVAGHAESLRESNRLKNALLASVSHDLRTPLTTIKAAAQELPRGDERVMLIEQEADRLNRMVGDLLDLSRVQGGATLTAIEITPVDDLMGAVLQRVTRAMPTRDIRPHLEEGGTLMVGRFDLAASVRVLVNLIENANKYSPAREPIEFSATRRGEWIDLTVMDAGPGVPLAERERIFEPFYRPSRAIPDSGSAGLGLAIARGLAEAQGGTLQYADRAGGGAIFTLSLPAADLADHIFQS